MAAISTAGSRYRATLAVALTSLAAVAAAPAVSRAATVDVGGYSFMPATVSVHPGDAVRWSWVGPDRNHTVSSDPGQAESFESHPGVPAALVTDGPAGESFSHTFTHTGTFSYVCRVHSFMQGKVTVVAAGKPLPDTTAPAARLRILGGSLRKLLRSHRLRVRVAVDEPASVKLKARAAGRSLATRTVRFGAAGRKTVVLRLTRRGRAKLAVRRRARIGVSARARDSAGNAKTVRAHKTFRSG